jgi:outer membrane receptor protein involved in Fe transport
MTKRMMQVLGCVTALCLSLILPVASHAQAVYGSITGTVTDSTGAAIPNAAITLTDEEKGTSVTATSNASGEFTIEHLIVDKYDLKIDAPGFQGYSAKGIQVYVDTSAKISAQLQLGKQSQTVEVSADAIPVLKTDRADVATVFSAKTVEDLPLYGGTRNFTSLQLLLPGAQILGWSHAADENPQGSQQIQIDGQAFGGVAYELDGTDNQDPILGIIVINPPIDAMAEAKITTQNFDAEFGKAVSAVIVASTKSGSNSFHGSAFDFRKTPALQATDPFTQPELTRGSYDIPSALYNQFGGSVGGPIIKDRLFFFGDYQGVRSKVANTAQDTIPTNTVIQSCLGNIVGPGQDGMNTVAGCDFGQYANASGAAGRIYQNVGGVYTQYPDNVIPAGLISQQAKNFLTQLNNNIMMLYPNYASQLYVSGTGDQALSTNFTASGSGLFNNNQWDARLDGQISEKAHAFARFSRFTDVLSGAQMFGNNLGGPGFGLGQPGYGGSSTGANDSFAGGMDYAVSSKLLTDFRLGYYRYNIIDVKNNQGSDYVSSTLMIPGENTADASTSGTGGFIFANPPSGGASSLFGSGLAASRCNCPLTEREDQFQVVNNWTKVIGSHSIKFGADLRYARNLRVPSDDDRTGNNYFDVPQTRDFNPAMMDPNSGTGGLAFASFALGEGNQFKRYVSVSTNAKEFQKRDFFYAQDTWRATPNLTINYGLRYELFFPEAVNGKGNGALMNLNTGYLSVAGVGGIGTNMNWQADKVAFSPRLGVAYQMNPKTVLRAGYGRSYDIGVFGSVFGHVVTQNLPVLADQAINPTGGASSAAFDLATGPSAYVFPTTPADGLLPAPGYAVSPKARPDPLRLPLLDAWNAAIQRSITPTLSVTIAYVGNKGTHTLADGDGNNTNPNEAGINLPAQFSVIPNLALHYDPSVSNSTVTDGIAGISSNGGTANNNFLSRYYGGVLPACQDPNYAQPASPGITPGSGQCGWNNGISYYHDSLDTHFNALQITVAKQLTHGLSFTSNYQWARAFDFNSGYVTWDKSIDYGRDSSVREQQETLYGLWQLPFGHNGMIGQNSPKWVDEIIGHWELSGAMNWAGGLPFTLSYNECGASIPGSAPCYPETNGQRLPLNLGKLNPVTHSRNYFQFVSGNILTAPAGGFSAAPLDTIGNTGRNNYFGPSFFNTDMSVAKHIPIHESIDAQFRLDAFNVFNHINPGNPGSTAVDGGAAGTYSTITGESAGGNPRYLAMTLRVQF